MRVQNAESNFSTTTTEKRVRIYACGGAGANAGRRFYELAPAPGLAHIDVCFLDTSRSNMDSSIKEADQFILPEADGSGKVRKENYTGISNVVKQIQGRYPPADLNIVFFSASGGSGSVFGPLILSELLQQEATALGIVIGSFDCIISGTNTLNTLKSLDAMSRKFNKVTTIMFENNRDGSNLKEVDLATNESITKLAILASGYHHGMDSRDISNFFHFNRHAPVEAQLALLEIVPSVEVAKQVNDPISIASLILKGEETTIGSLHPDYQTTGYSDADGPMGELRELHFVINVADTHALFGVCQGEVDKMVERRNARPRQSSLGDLSTATDDGMIL